MLSIVGLLLIKSAPLSSVSSIGNNRPHHHCDMHCYHVTHLTPTCADDACISFTHHCAMHLLSCHTPDHAERDRQLRRTTKPYKDAQNRLFGRTRLASHVPSSSQVGKRYHHYDDTCMHQEHASSAPAKLLVHII